MAGDYCSYCGAPYAGPAGQHNCKPMLKEVKVERADELREAAYWYREMMRVGGPDGSDHDYAIELDLDHALGDWKPDLAEWEPGWDHGSLGTTQMGTDDTKFVLVLFAVFTVALIVGWLVVR